MNLTLVIIERCRPPSVIVRTLVHDGPKSRTLWTIVRKDQYEMSGDRIIIKCLGAVGWIEVKYRGIIHLRGERGELRIRYDADRGKWYACIAFEIFEKMVRGEWSRCRCGRRAT
jgi:putative transposase